MEGLSEREVAFVDHLRQSEAQGVSLSEYCRGRDLDVGVLYRIKQGLAHRGVSDCREVAVKKARALPPRFCAGAYFTRGGERGFNGVSDQAS